MLSKAWIWPLVAGMGICALIAPDLAAAEDSVGPVIPAPAPAVVNPTYDPGYDNMSDYFSHWFDRVDRAQAEQPHWMTPIITVTPRLEEEFRWDQYWEHAPNGATIDVYDSGKGLELIPTETEELILNTPPYVTTGNIPRGASGFADWPVFLFKQRLASANEQNGNYILTPVLLRPGADRHPAL